MSVKVITRYWERLNRPEKLLLAFLLFTQVYYFYRYAFRVQSTLAPPGYETTSEAYQYPKYVAAAAVLGLLAYLFFTHRETLTHLLGRLRREPVWLLLIGFALYCGLSAFRFGLEPGPLSHIAKFVFVVPFALVAAVIWREKSPQALAVLFLAASLVYHVLYEAVMFVHFEATGRLPALTFSRLVPRYGAGWDDPNGFGAFVVLALIGVLFLRSPSNRRLHYGHMALVFVLALLAGLTYSLTAAAGLALGLALLLLARRLDIAKIVVVAGAAAVLGVGLLASGHLDIIVEGKLKSIEAHTRTKTAEPTPAIQLGATVVPGSSQPPPVQQPPSQGSAPETEAADGRRSPVENAVRAMVGRSDHVHFHETMYLLIYFNFGLVGLSMFLAAQAMTLYRAIQQWRSSRSDLYLLGAILLGVFLFMNSFLPLYAIFPVNLYMWLVVGMVWARPAAAIVSEKTAVSIEPASSDPAFVQG